MQKKTIAISGVETRYFETDASGGIPLVILHGWASQAERWSEVIRILDAKKIKVIAIDLPGFGQTAAPKESWGLDEYKNFVLVFLKSLGVDKFNLLGHSFGGRIAIKLSARHVSGLAKLLLVASAGVTPRSKARISIYKLATKTVKPIFILPPLNIFQNIARRIIYRFSGSYDYYLQKGAMKETFRNVIAEDLTPHLCGINVQTCIIWGKKDIMTPLSDAYIIHRNIKNSRLVILENGNHSMNLQMPEKLAEEIFRFL